MKYMDWIMNKKIITQWMKFNCWNNVDTQIKAREILALLTNDSLKLRAKWYSSKNKQLLFETLFVKIILKKHNLEFNIISLCINLIYKFFNIYNIDIKKLMHRLMEMVIISHICMINIFWPPTMSSHMLIIYCQYFQCRSQHKLQKEINHMNITKYGTVKKMGFQNEQFFNKVNQFLAKWTFFGKVDIFLAEWTIFFCKVDIRFLAQWISVCG